MRQYMLVASLTLLSGLTTPMVRAEPPTHTKKSTFSGSFDVPPGELCDFEYHQEFTIKENIAFFADGRFIAHDIQFVTHANNETGFSLSEVDHIQFLFDSSRERFRVLGLYWHLRTPDGKLVVVQAGQIVIDANTGQIVKATPNLNPDFAGVVCPALGGNPAS